MINSKCIHTDTVHCIESAIYNFWNKKKLLCENSVRYSIYRPRFLTILLAKKKNNQSKIDVSDDLFHSGIFGNSTELSARCHSIALLQSSRNYVTPLSDNSRQTFPDRIDRSSLATLEIVEGTILEREIQFDMRIMK